VTPRSARARPARGARARPPVAPAPRAEAAAVSEEPSRLDRRWWLWLVVAIGLVAILATYRSYGSNWDEAVQAHYGELAVDYFRSGFIDRRVNRFLNLRFYGPLVEMIPALFHGEAKTGAYELRHLLIPLFGLATLPAVFAYASLARIPGLPLLATLALATMPRLYGDWFNNSKDVPFACLFALSMYLLAALFRARPFTPWRVLACGLAFGLALDVRPGGLPILAAFFVAAALLSLTIAHRDVTAARPPVTTVLLRGAGVFAVAWAVMVLPWPWAHENPLAHPITAMREAASLGTAYAVLFEGAVVSSSALPRHYLLEYLLITTPPALLALCVVGIVAGLVRLRHAAAHSFTFLLTLGWLLLPLMLFTILRPNVYDGIRHFLFVLPAIAILGAYGASWLCQRLAPPRWRALAMAACAVLLLLPIKDLVALHPYQTTYFNGLVGGVAGADGKYETEYWLTSYREAIGWVNERAARRPEAIVGLAVAGDGYITPWVEYYARSNVRPRIVTAPPEPPSLPDGTDYYIATKRFGFDRGHAAAPVVHTIGRAGAVFTVIKGRSAP